MKKRHFKTLFGGILLFSGLFLAAMQFTKFERFLQLLQQIKPVWIAAAIVFQLCTYVSLALLWKQALINAMANYPLRSQAFQSIRTLLPCQRRIPNRSDDGFQPDLATFPTSPVNHTASTSGLGKTAESKSIRHAENLANTLRWSMKSSFLTYILPLPDGPGHLAIEHGQQQNGIETGDLSIPAVLPAGISNRSYSTAHVLCSSQHSKANVGARYVQVLAYRPEQLPRSQVL